MVYWDADNRKDLLVGQADGRIAIFLNNGSDDEPVFGAAAYLQVGEPGFKTDIDVGARANSTVADWNNDGRKDLVVGALDGRINIIINEGTDTEPDFRTVQYAQADGADLFVPSNRSSPVVMDLDDDGNKDLLSGNTYGELVFYSNVGTDEAPTFSGFTLVEADGVPIDLEGSPRSRPFVCDWTGDGLPDVLIGAGDGLVRLYQGRCRADLDGDGRVGQSDLGILLADWGCSGGDCPGDCDGDGDTDESDLGLLLAEWGCGI